MSDTMNPFLGFQPEEHRYRLLEIAPELLGNLLLNPLLDRGGGSIQALQVEGLPADTRIQALHFDYLRNVIQLRLWSRQWSVLEPGSEIPLVEVKLYRLLYQVLQEPSPLEGPEGLQVSGRAVLKERKRGYEFL